MDDRCPGVQTAYVFGPYRLVPQQRLLVCARAAVPLAPKLFDLLLLLVGDAGRIVTHERISQVIWPDVFVSETNLRQKVWLLRKALRAPGTDLEYIETVPRRGYRFLAPVTLVELAQETAAPDPPGRDVGFAPGAPPAHENARRRGATSPASPSRRPPALRSPMKLLGALVLITPLASEHPSLPDPSGAAAAPAAESRRSVVLLRLRGHSGSAEDGWIADAFTEMLRVELASSAAFRLVPAETVDVLARDLSPPRVLSLSPGSLARVRHTLGGHWVVTGSLVTAGSDRDASLRVDLLVQCTESREIIGAVTRSGTRGGLTELASAAGRDLRRALGAVPAPR